MDLLSLFLKYPSVCTDTRKIKTGDLFFALKGPSFNGNQFAKNALAAGAAFAIVDEADFVIENCILVDDVLDALQQLATDYRRYLKIPVIAVTGSNGKTTTKELTTLVLSQKLKVYATQGNLNNHIGVPLTILSIPNDCEIAVIELGANHLKETELLCKIAEPDHGLVTNCGMDHLEGYGSIEGVIKGSAELFEYFKSKNKGTVFVHKDDEVLVEMAKILSQESIPNNLNNCEIVLYPSDAEIASNDFYVNVAYKNKIEIKSNLIGDFNFVNIACALKIGEYFGVSDEKAAAAIESYLPKNNRSQVVDQRGAKFILDAYNANPSSMSLAVNNFAQIKADKKMVILGDMFEMGDYSAAEHKKMIDLVNGLAFEQAVFCGEEFFKYQSDKGLYFKTKEALKNWFDAQDLTNYTILLKGSRGMALEKLLQ